MPSETVKQIIERVGWVVFHIFDPTGKDPSFSYTAGLSEKNLPELIAIGLPQDSAHQMLNDLAKRLMDGETLPLNTAMDDIAEGFDAQLIETSRALTDEYMFQALDRYPDYHALQLVWPDEANRFPWQEGFTRRFLKFQPLLGPAPNLH